MNVNGNDNTYYKTVINKIKCGTIEYLFYNFAYKNSKIVLIADTKFPPS